MPEKNMGIEQFQNILISPCWWEAVKGDIYPTKVQWTYLS